MTVSGGGVEALFYRGPITSGDVASWNAPGVLQDSGIGGTGTKLSQIAAAPGPPALTDTLIGVSGGTTDYQWTLSQISSTIGGGGGMAIGGAVTSGTAGSVLFVGAGAVLAQDNAKFFWDDAAFNLYLKAGSTLSLGGSSSGTVTLKTAAAAGTWSMTLPTTAGTNTYVLTTDGAGVTTWTAPGAATMAIGSAVTGGTTGSVLFIDGSGNLGQDNAKFFWDDTGFALNLKAGSSLKLGGSSSGTVTVNTAAAAGTWTLTLPTTAGTSSYFLQTNGSGVTTWAAGGGGGGMAIGGAVTGGTSGSVLFVDGGGNLAQDNANFSWDDTNKSLDISGTPALYKVPNGSGDNWFEGGAGNFTLTGYQNFGTGASALVALTTGRGNVALGSNALQATTTGDDNLAIGTLALANNTSGLQNVGIGVDAMLNETSGQANVAIGFNAMSGLIDGVSNVSIGKNALNGNSHGSSNVGIGVAALAGLTGTNHGDVGIGDSVGTSFTGGDQNTLIGYLAGLRLTGTCASNTWIGGYWGPSGSVNSTIAITLGSQYLLGLDFNHTTSQVWSFQNSNSPQGLSVYNTSDGYSAPPPTNYERARMDWTLTSNVFRVATEAGGTGTVRLIAIDAFQKAGAPAAGDLPSGTWGVINDTSGGNTWLVYNNSGTIRKVQLV